MQVSMIWVICVPHIDNCLLYSNNAQLEGLEIDQYIFEILRSLNE